MSGRYAENTSVTSEKSRGEIERTLARYGADQFSYGWDANRAMIMFRAHERLIRFVLPMPDRTAREFRLTPTGRDRSQSQAEQAWEQACRQRWRALALAVKAKLEAVEAGISEFEHEFMAQIVLPDGGTVGDWMAPQIEQAYQTGLMPSALPALGPGGES
jgi:hypothetical protein